MLTPAEERLAAIHDANGRAAFASGHYRDAQRHFERLLDLAPTEAVTANLGQACQALGEFARAERLYRQVLSVVPGNAAVWNQLGDVLFLQRRYEEAEAAYRRAMEFPDVRASANARNGLALILEAQGKLHDAITLLEQAVSGAEAGQARARMLTNLGGLHQKLGHRTEAATYLSRALDEMERAVGAGHPDVARILEDYGKILQKTGRKAEAKEAARRARSIRSSFTATIDYRDLK
jgi:tetratricopeptide (TPR) repeat protein